MVIFKMNNDNVDSTDYDVFTVSEWNTLAGLLNKLSGCVVNTNKTIMIIGDESSTV